MSEHYSTGSGAGQGARLRDQHGEVTRRAILDAAMALFRERGYARTPVRALAERAGVAVQTVYSTFGSKPGVLVGLVDRLDQDADVPAIAGRALATDDPDEMLGLVATLERRVRERGAEVLRLLREGAATEPEVAEVVEATFARHRGGVEATCGRLVALGRLREGLTLETAIATGLALTSVEAYEETVRRRGWTHDEYEAWLAGALRHALVEPPARRRRGAR